MPHFIKRRQFLIGSAALSAASLLGGWWFFKVRKRDIHPAIKTIVRKELYYLNINDEDLIQFSNELKQAMVQTDLTRTSWSGLLAPLFGHSALLDFFPSTQYLKKQFAEFLCSEFLLSSDFFQNNADPSKPVHYLGYYYLKKGGCNPLAKF